MTYRERITKNFESQVRKAHREGRDFVDITVEDGYKILALLEEQEGYVSVPFSWLVKFCTHIDFVEPLTDAEREEAWRRKLRQQFGINGSKKGGEVE